MLLRLSTDDAYGRCAQEERGICSLGRNQPAASASLTGQRRDDNALRKRLLPDLLRRNPDLATVEKLIGWLESSASRETSRAATQDLAVAHYLAAALAQSGVPLLDAFEATENALTADPKSPALNFNRALILEALGLPEQARVTWRRFIDLETDELWRHEGEERLRRIAQGLTDGSRPGSTRSAPCPTIDSTHDTLNSLLKATVQRHRSGVNPSSRTPPDSVNALQALIDCQPITAKSSLAREIQALSNGPAGDEFFEQRLRGLEQYFEAWAAFSANDLERSQGSLDAASDLLAEIDTPMRRWLAIPRTSIDVYRSNNLEAIERIEGVLGQEPDDPWLRFRAHWIGGMAEGRRGALTASHRHFAEASKIAADLNEPVAAASLRTRLAETFDLLGQDRRAWNEWLAALDLLARDETHPLRTPALWDAGFGAMEERRFELAEAFLEEATAAATRTNDDLLLADASALLAEAQSELDDRQAALRSLARAREAADRLPEGPLKQRPLAGTKTAEAKVAMLEGQAARAIAILSPLIDQADSLELDIDLLRLHARRATAFRQLDRPEDEEQDLEAVVRNALQIRQRVEVPAFDRSFSALVNESFGRLIELTARRGDGAAEALLWLDASRAYRTRQPSREIDQAFIERWAKNLPDGTGYAVFFESAHELLIWSLSQRGLEFRQQALPQQISRDLNLLGRDLPPEETLERLHEVLIAPVLASVPRLDTLLLLTEGRLARVPFAALKAAGDTEPLVTKIAIGFIPRLLVDLADSGPSAKRSRHVLAVGVGARPSEPFEHLTELPGVAVEIEHVLEAYEDGHKLLGAEASIEQLREKLASADVFHFAGHAVPHPEDPFLSFLLLTDGARTVPLSGEDLGTWNLSALQAIVLSACNSSETLHNGLAPLGVPLLEAGAGAVIGSPWPVDDDSAKIFTSFLHEEINKANSVIAAVQKAQIRASKELERTGQRESSWASWQALVRPTPQIAGRGNY